MRGLSLRHLSIWLRLDGVDEVDELDRVLDEEDWKTKEERRRASVQSCFRTPKIGSRYIKPTRDVVSIRRKEEGGELEKRREEERRRVDSRTKVEAHPTISQFPSSV